MNETPFWMKGAKADRGAKTPPVAQTEQIPVAAKMPIGPAVSQAEAESGGEVFEALDAKGRVIFSAAIEVLPPEALACVSAQGLAASTAVQLKFEFRAAFANAANVLEQAATVEVTDVGQIKEMARAKELRLQLKSIRCAIENVRKEQKADSLLRGKVIDGMANALKAHIEPAEKYLQEQEEFAVRVEQKRIDDLREERSAALAPFVDPSAPPSGVDLAYLSPDVWESLLEGAKLTAQHREAVAKREEQARIEREEADRAERQRLAQENERLRKEQAEKDAAAEIERKAAAEKQAAVDAENKRLRDEAEKAQRAERDRLYKEETERIDKERAERVEAARLAEIERKAASAPDKEKALAYLSALRAVPLPVFTSESGKRVSADIVRALEGFCKVIAQGVNNEL
jgi:chemotaxis protein histidine kinase CheA